MALCPQSIEMDEANQQAYQIDPNFEPQGRPRSCTWPLNRPNVEDEKNNEKTLKIEPTIEESDELTEEESMTADQQQPPPPLMCQMPQPGSYLNSMKQDDNIFQFSSPTGFQPENNLASDFSGIVLTTGNVIQEQPNSYIDNKPTTMVALPATTYQKSSMVNSTIDIMPSTSNQHPSIHLDDGKAFKPKPLQNKVGGTSSNPGGSGLNPAPKPKPSSRKNAWGNMSYADLITQAIESSPDKRLTLAQIYDWMVKNVAYFKDKGDSNSSAGWKNSIRHNLSLHSKFKRTQNEGTGKSSWWTINYEAKPGKPHRRRASSMDPPANSRLKKNRNDAKKKSDQCKKHNQAIAKNNGALKQDSPGWSPRQEDDFPDITRFSTTEYRQRTSSNASSIGGPMSPPGGHSGSFVLGSLKSGDFDDDLMGMGSSSSGNMQCGDGNMLFSLVNEIKNDEGNGGYPVDGNDGQSTGGLGYGTNYDQSSIDLSSELEATPNLARLLQQNSIKSPTSTKSNHKSLPIRSKVTKVSMDSTRPRSRANTMPRLQPQPKYDITSPPGDQCRKIASCQSEQLTSSTRNQQQQSSVGCHGNTSSSSPMSFIRHHQHQQQQQQQQQDRQPNNILYSLLNTTQQSSGPPTSMGEPIFTSLQHHHQQQSVVAQTSKPTTSSSSGYPQDNGAFDGFGDNVQYVQVPEECRRPNSQLSPFTRRIPATLPSIQFSDKTVINQDPNLNSHTRQLTEMDCQQQQQQPQQPQVDDVVNHFPEDINLFDSSFSDIGEVDMSALIGDIKGGIEPNDLNKYFNNPSSSMNEVNMEMDGGDKNETTTTVYQSMSSAAQQQQQQQQMHQQQLQQQQVQRHQQQQQLHRMHQPWNHEINQINDYNFIDPPPQYQQLQSQHNNQLQQQQRQTRNDQQYLFMTSDASSSNDQHQMMSQHIYDDPAILPGGAASVGFGINSSAESPNNGGGGGGHYNFQSPQQCYQQVVPQQQHLMMSGQATPISSATNYKT